TPFPYTTLFRSRLVLSEAKEDRVPLRIGTLDELIEARLTESGGPRVEVSVDAHLTSVFRNPLRWRHAGSDDLEASPPAISEPFDVLALSWVIQVVFLAHERHVGSDPNGDQVGKGGAVLSSAPHHGWVGRLLEALRCNALGLVDSTGKLPCSDVAVRDDEPARPDVAIVLV